MLSDFSFGVGLRQLSVAKVPSFRKETFSHAVLGAKYFAYFAALIGALHTRGPKGLRTGAKTERDGWEGFWKGHGKLGKSWADAK